MIKNGIKNYFINLKHIFTPLGVLALAVALGLSVLIPGAVSAVKNMATEVAEITGNSSVDFDSLKDCIFDAAEELDWEDPMAALNTVLDGDWLSETFDKCINILIADGEKYTEQIAVTIEKAIQQIAACIIVFVLLIILGLFGGYLFTKFLVRQTMAKRAWWKFFFVYLIDSAIAAGLILISLWLQTLWKPSAFISGIVVLLLLGFGSLIEAYIIHGWKKIDFKTIVNLQNLGKMWLADVIIFVITFILALIAILITNAIVGILLSVPLFEVCFLVINLNAESYVKELVQIKQNNAMEILSE